MKHSMLRRGALAALSLIAIPGAVAAQPAPVGDAPCARAELLPIVLSGSGRRLRAQGPAACAPSAGPVTLPAFIAFAARSPALDAPLPPDRTLRAALDAPLGPVELSVRVNGLTAPREEFATDAALAPLGFFASSNLLGGALVTSASLPFDGGRLMLFGAASLPQTAALSPFAGRIAPPPVLPFLLDGDVVYSRSPLRQTAAGAGYWMRPDDRTVVGVTASAFRQQHSAFDITDTNVGFDHATRLYNLGLAVAHDFGGWQGFAAGEVTQMRAPRAVGAVELTDGILVSGAVGVRREAVLFAGDALAFTVRSIPHALSGRLVLNDLAAEGIGSQLMASETPLWETTGRTVRLETSYALRGRTWSLAASAGADLTGADPDYQLMARGRIGF